MRLTLLGFVNFILLDLTHTVSSLACFECLSVDGEVADCEDRFGPHNVTGHLLSPDCRTGFLKFRTSYCIKIKGHRKDTGQHIMIRTCSMDDWGSQCGDIAFEQGPSRRIEMISGCLATCNYDGCNSATAVKPAALLGALAAVALLW